MKRIIILLLTMLPLCIQAQHIHAYVTTGLNLSQIEGDELKGFRHVGFNGGVGALTALDDNYRWGLSVEALFTQRGASNMDSPEPYRGKYTLNYVDIPLLFHYQDPYGGMLIGAGIIYGRLVQQPHGNLEYRPNVFIPDTSDLTFLKNDLSVALDFRFTVWKGLQFNLRWQTSILPIKRDWKFTEINGQVKRTFYRDAYNQSIALRLIWQF